MFTILIGDVKSKLGDIESDSVDCVVTSTPYWAQRDYGHPDQIGNESHPSKFVSNLVEVFNGIKRILKLSGTVWLNIGDTYSRQGGSSRKPRHWDGRKESVTSLKDLTQSGLIGIPPKNMIGVPWMLAFAMRDSGWFLRGEYPWIKTNPTPDPVDDRPENSMERFFLFSKSSKYYFDLDAAKAYIGKTVWRNSEGIQFFISSVASNKSLGHATFPPQIITPMILASCPTGGIVLDPFSGSGSTGVSALEVDRNYIGIELVEKEAEWSINRLNQIQNAATQIELI